MYNQALKGRILNLLTYEKELYALVMAMQKMEAICAGPSICGMNRLLEFEVSAGAKGGDTHEAKMELKITKL